MANHARVFSSRPHQDNRIGGASVLDTTAGQIGFGMFAVPPSRWLARGIEGAAGSGGLAESVEAVRRATLPVLAAPKCPMAHAADEHAADGDGSQGGK